MGFDDFVSMLPPVVKDHLTVWTIGLGAAILFAVTRYSSSPEVPQPGKLQRRISSSKPFTELPKFSVQHQQQARMNERRVSVAGESLSPADLAAAPRERVVYPKTDAERERLLKHTKKNLLFRNLDSKQLQEILDAMKPRQVQQGEIIITQGEEDNLNFYLVDSGKFDIFVNGNKVTEVGPGGSFGELALLYNQPRAATVKASEPSVVYAVDRQTFRRVVVSSTMRKRQLHEAFLKEVQLLADLSTEERMKLADALEPATFEAGELIVSEGEIGDTFFIVEEGEVVIRKLNEHGQSVEMARKKRGDYFGEIALLTDGFRAATVEALAHVDCLVLDKQAFIRLLGPCVDILKRNMRNYQQYRDQL